MFQAGACDCALYSVCITLNVQVQCARSCARLLMTAIAAVSECARALKGAWAPTIRWGTKGLGPVTF